MDKLVALVAVVMLVACGAETSGQGVDILEQDEPTAPSADMDIPEPDAGQAQQADASAPVLTLAHDSSTLPVVRADAGQARQDAAAPTSPSQADASVSPTAPELQDAGVQGSSTVDATSPVVTPEPSAPVIVPPVAIEPVTPAVVVPPAPVETQCLDQAPLTAGVTLYRGGVWNCMTNSAPRCAGAQACERDVGWVMPANTQLAYWGRSGNVSDLSYPFLASGTCAVAKGAHTCLMTSTDMTGPQTVQVDMVREPLMGWVSIVTALERADGSCPLTCS